MHLTNFISNLTRKGQKNSPYKSSFGSVFHRKFILIKMFHWTVTETKILLSGRLFVHLFYISNKIFYKACRKPHIQWHPRPATWITILHLCTSVYENWSYTNINLLRGVTRQRRFLHVVKNEPLSLWFFFFFCSFFISSVKLPFSFFSWVTPLPRSPL